MDTLGAETPTAKWTHVPTMDGGRSQGHGQGELRLLAQEGFEAGLGPAPSRRHP